MKLSISLIAATLGAVVSASIVLDADSSLQQVLYARHEILPRGDRPSPRRSSPPRQAPSSQPSSSIPPTPGGMLVPDSPRMINMKADAAEERAKAARQNFIRTGVHHLARLEEFSDKPDHKDPDIAHRNRMAALNDYRAVPKAKQAQSDAYKEAAEAARRAGRSHRQDRNSRKAASTAVESQYHNAHLDMLEHGSTGLHEYTKYQQASHLRGIKAPWVDQHKVNALNAQVAEGRSGRKATDLMKQMDHLRKYEGGRDTDSSSDGEGP